MSGNRENIKRRMRDVQAHPWKNKFHLEMPFGLINDPNGLCYAQGKYHIFFQWNPNGCDHKTKHWGLVTTRDFIHYSTPRIILRPDEPFDRNGCYSGSARERGGALQLFYTGNVKNARGERESYQCLASYDPDGTARKEGVLIERQPKGYTAHFRDPYIFSLKGISYLLLGAQTTGGNGRALLYRETGPAVWEFAGELKTALPDFGYMWECPNMVDFGDAGQAFMFCPQGLPGTKVQYQNLHQSGYVIGTLNATALTMEHGEFQELDRGFDFYAPQVFGHAGRQLMIGWIGMPDKEAEYPTDAFGWRFALTMPRELTCQNGKLYQVPARELTALRASSLARERNLTVEAYCLRLPRRLAEVALEVHLSSLDEVELRLDFGAESIVFGFDKRTRQVCVDRTAMRLGGGGVRRFNLAVDDRLHLRLFIDQSAIEVYFQHGAEAATLAYFPQDEACALRLSAGASPLHIETLSAWLLKEIEYA